jgi:cytochrome P450
MKFLATSAAGGAAVVAARRRNATAADAQKGPLAPAPPGVPFFGSLPKIRKDNAQTFLEGWRAYGDVVRYPVGLFDIYCVAHPDDVKHILQSNHQNYKHPEFLNRKLREIVGDGLVTTEGDYWRSQRRLCQPAFHRQRIASYCTLMTDTTSEMLDTWKPFVDSGEPIDMRSEMMHISLSILAKALFGADWTQELKVMEPVVTVANEHADRRLLTAVDMPLWMPFPKYRQFLKARETFDEIVYGLIRERRADGEDHGDLTSMLLSAKDEETGETMSDTQVRDELMTFLMAGHETVSAGLAWVWYLLSKNPECWDRVVEEVTTVLDGRVPTIDDLPNLKYVSMVIDETMRLYPPLFVLPRTPIEGEMIGGYYIPSGSTFLALCPYVTHRHTDFWDNPEGFEPERFTPERVKERHRFAYFPFAAGPRKCIGDYFALIEMQIIVAMVAQRYRPDLLPGFPVTPQPAISLRPRHGLQMTVKPVQHSATAEASR